MGKFGAILATIVIVFITYLLMLVVIPFLSDIVSTVNTTVGNVSATLPGATEGLLAAPLILWFAPAVIGMIVVILILRFKG